MSVANHESTEEQKEIIEHSSGRHAVVLAVAGSGKTTTMVQRLRYLIEVRGVAPSSILVLQYNALARKQFKEKLVEGKLPPSVGSQVHTFHSFSYGVLLKEKAVPREHLVWTAEHHEKIRRCIHKAIRAAEARRQCKPNELNPDEAEQAISLWKASLIPPERAGYRGHAAMPVVYAEFETLRLRQGALTYDDFVPLALKRITRAQDLGRPLVPTYSHIIVDEYQDVNYGQQRLIEVLANESAEVMVVGDDDQTIYEWRGARPHYIRYLFPARFTYLATESYRLTRSFRFGPVLARCAENVIGRNANRHAKRVVAHSTEKRSHVSIHSVNVNRPSEADERLGDDVQSLLASYAERGEHDLREKIVVLGRTYAQLSGMEAEFLKRGIPYRVEGNAPFFQRREISALLDYLKIAVSVIDALTVETGAYLESIVNVPNRFIPKLDVKTAINWAIEHRGTALVALLAMANDADSTRREETDQNIQRLADCLTECHELARKGVKAHHLLSHLIEDIDYYEHFRSYYGDGEAAADKIESVGCFLDFVNALNLDVNGLREYFEKADTGAGRPADQQIMVTTVFRTKGLEFDNVIIPSCHEGHMPVGLESECLTFDRAGLVEDLPLSDAIESERRLFYVAITRARHTVILGSVERRSDSRDGPSRSRFIDEMGVANT